MRPRSVAGSVLVAISVSGFRRPAAAIVFRGLQDIVQFLPLGMAIAEDHPDRTRFLLTTMRPREMDSSDMTEITLMSPGYIFVMYTDLVYDGGDEQVRLQIEQVVRQHQDAQPKEICNPIRACAVNRDEHGSKSVKKTASTTRQYLSLNASERSRHSPSRSGYPVRRNRSSKRKNSASPDLPHLLSANPENAAHHTVSG
jgi:hypothetical protein